MGKICMVYGCQNCSDQGHFVGDMCAPCYEMITRGDTSVRSTNFINKLKTITELKYLTRALEEYYYWEKSKSAGEGWTFEDCIKPKIRSLTTALT